VLGVRGAVQRIEVLERGVSPRVVRARVVGTVNSRVLTGPQIRARLGLYDTWLQFTKVSSSAAAARGSLLGSALPRRALVGEFQPAPHGTALGSGAERAHPRRLQRRAAAPRPVPRAVGRGRRAPPYGSDPGGARAHDGVKRNVTTSPSRSS
jgi:hypothetical protein